MAIAAFLIDRHRIVALVGLMTGALGFAAIPFSNYSFAGHELVHLDLLLVSAPLLLLGFGQSALNSSWAAALRVPLPAFGAYAAAVALAHVPLVDAASLAQLPTHVLVHAVLLFAALLFWAQIIGAQAISFPLRLAALLIATGLHAIVGAIVAFSGRQLYSGYAVAPDDVVRDEAIGGLLFWIPPKLLFIAAISVLFFRWLEHEDRTAANEPLA